MRNLLITGRTKRQTTPQKTFRNELDCARPHNVIVAFKLLLLRYGTIQLKYLWLAQIKKNIYRYTAGCR